MGSVSGQNLVPEGGYGEVSSDAGGGGGVVLPNTWIAKKATHEMEDVVVILTYLP